MPGIYGMAALTIAVTTLLCVTVLGHLAQSGRHYYGLILVGLPLSLIVNQFIKTPLITSLASWAGLPLKIGLDVPLWFLIAVWFNAPIFEEAIKVLPMALPGPRKCLQDVSQALCAGLALGMGFGLGEAAYLAYGIAQSPAYRELPWYMFTGFAWERLIVTFAHGLMTSIAVAGIPYGRRNTLLGYLTAVGLHALINLGPCLLALRLISPTVSSMGSYIAILAAFVIFQRKEQMAKRMNGTTSRAIIYFER